MRKTKSAVNTDRYVEEAIVQLLGLKAQTGTSASALRKFAQSCGAQAIRANKGATSYQGLDIHRLGSVLRAWHKQTAYLTPQGLPRPLMVKGPTSLRTLVTRFYPAKKFNLVFKRLVETRLIQQVGDAVWAPSGRTARITQLSHETLEHLAEGVSRYVETVTRNVTAANEKNVLFERSCKVTRLPVAEFSAFREYVDQQALCFLTAVDDWLEGRNKSLGKTKGKLCTAGVYTFAYVRPRPESELRQVLHQEVKQT